MKAILSLTVGLLSVPALLAQSGQPTKVIPQREPARATCGVPLPSPSGTSAVGRAQLTFSGEAAILFYPTVRSPKTVSEPADYASAALVNEAANSGYYSQSPETIRCWATVKTHSTSDANPTGRSPLVILMPGQGIYGFQYTAIAEELASRGYVVAVLDYYGPGAPERGYDPNDAAAATDDMARKAAALRKVLNTDARWSKHISSAAAVMGHSIGGAAAIAAARLDGGFRAVIDMDGAVFGSADKGATRPTLVMRSEPVYSDADLAKHGRTREQMDKMGEDIRRSWVQFVQRSPEVSIRVISLKGTAHMSFSDAPFVMPETITHFGGTFATAIRTHEMVSTCTVEFLDVYVRDASDTKLSKCTALPGVSSQVSQQKGRTADEPPSPGSAQQRDEDNSESSSGGE